MDLYNRLPPEVKLIVFKQFIWGLPLRQLYNDLEFYAPRIAPYSVVIQDYTLDSEDNPLNVFPYRLSLISAGDHLQVDGALSFFTRDPYFVIYNLRADRFGPHTKRLGEYFSDVPGFPQSRKLFMLDYSYLETTRTNHYSDIVDKNIKYSKRLISHPSYYPKSLVVVKGLGHYETTDYYLYNGLYMDVLFDDIDVFWIQIEPGLAQRVTSYPITEKKCSLGIIKNLIAKIGDEDDYDDLVTQDDLGFLEFINYDPHSIGRLRITGVERTQRYSETSHTTEIEDSTPPKHIRELGFKYIEVKLGRSITLDRLSLPNLTKLKVIGTGTSLFSLRNSTYPNLNHISLNINTRTYFRFPDALEYPDHSQIGPTRIFQRSQRIPTGPVDFNSLLQLGAFTKIPNQCVITLSTNPYKVDYIPRRYVERTQLPISPGLFAVIFEKTPAIEFDLSSPSIFDGLFYKPIDYHHGVFSRLRYIMLRQIVPYDTGTHWKIFEHGELFPNLHTLNLFLHGTSSSLDDDVVYNHWSTSKFFEPGDTLHLSFNLPNLNRLTLRYQYLSDINGRGWFPINFSRMKVPELRTLNLEGIGMRFSELNTPKLEELVLFEVHDLHDNDDDPDYVPGAGSNDIVSVDVGRLTIKQKYPSLRKVGIIYDEIYDDFDFEQKNPVTLYLSHDTFLKPGLMKHIPPLTRQLYAN